MAGDSEQTLQNHQQPNGGEPFLIGVSGGTASGKVRVRAPCPHSGRRMAGARGPCQLQPATAWPARSSLRAAALRRRQTPRRLGARRWGSAGRPGQPRVRGAGRPYEPSAGMVHSLAGSRRWL